jgi:hypothetical protein
VSPYIVTTKRPNKDDAPVWDRFDLSRRAVATLDEARKVCHDAVLASELPTHEVMDPAHDRFYDAALTLPDGGTVGPLPDGTVIEVEATTWADLASASVIDPAVRNRAVNGDTAMRQRILDAYNAQQKEQL